MFHHYLRTRKWVLSIFLTVFTLLSSGLLLIQAQETIVINVGENRPGNIANPATPITFNVPILTPQTVNVQVLGITTGFFPSLRVVDPSGIVLQDIANTSAQSIIQASVSFGAAGLYTVHVGSASGTTGDFLLAVQAGQPLLPPSPLTLGVQVPATVSAQQTLNSYSFSANLTEVLLLTVRSDSTTNGSVIRLKESITGETIALSNADLVGNRFRIPVGINSYLLEVSHGGSTLPESYVVCLELENGTTPCGGVVAAPPTVAIIPTEVLPPTVPGYIPPPIASNGPCQVVSAAGNNINVRSGPSLSDSIITQLPSGQLALVIGRQADNSWYQIQFNGIIGWVSATVIVVGGQCGVVPVVIPTLPPLPPTFTPTPTPTATLTPTLESPTFTPTPTPTWDGTLFIPVTFIAPVTFVPPLIITPLIELPPIGP